MKQLSILVILVLTAGIMLPGCTGMQLPDGASGQAVSARIKQIVPLGPDAILAGSVPLNISSIPSLLMDEKKNIAVNSRFLVEMEIRNNMDSGFYNTTIRLSYDKEHILAISPYYGDGRPLPAAAGGAYSFDDAFLPKQAAVVYLVGETKGIGNLTSASAPFSVTVYDGQGKNIASVSDDVRIVVEKK